MFTNNMVFKENIPRSFFGDGVNKLWVFIDSSSKLRKRPLQNLQVNVSNKDFAGNHGMTSVVGETIVGERRDAVNVMFEYNVGTYDTIRFQTGTGDIAHSNSKAVLKTGVGVGKFELRSKDPVRYVTGHERECRKRLLQRWLRAIWIQKSESQRWRNG